MILEQTRLRRFDAGCVQRWPANALRLAGELAVTNRCFYLAVPASMSAMRRHSVPACVVCNHSHNPVEVPLSPGLQQPPGFATRRDWPCTAMHACDITQKWQSDNINLAMPFILRCGGPLPLLHGVWRGGFMVRLSATAASVVRSTDLETDTLSLFFLEHCGGFYIDR